MNSRSRIHMLTVAAARLELDCGDPKLVEALRSAAKWHATTKSEKRARDEAEANERRADRQRTLFAMLPSTNATDRLKDTMLQRAYDLLWDGDMARLIQESG